MAYIETNRPISAIFADLVSQSTALMRKEGQLARAEMSEKIGEIGMAAGLVIGGAVLLIGLALLAIGVRRLKAGRLVPTRTIARLRHDAAIATQQMRNDHGIPERAA